MGSSVTSPARDRSTAPQNAIVFEPFQDHLFKLCGCEQLVVVISVLLVIKHMGKFVPDVQSRRISGQSHHSSNTIEAPVDSFVKVDTSPIEMRD